MNVKDSNAFIFTENCINFKPLECVVCWTLTSVVNVQQVKYTMISTKDKYTMIPLRCFNLIWTMMDASHNILINFREDLNRVFVKQTAIRVVSFLMVVLWMGRNHPIFSCVYDYWFMCEY